MTYQIGSIVPLDYARRPFTGPMDPKWFIFCTPPQKETAAQAWLAKHRIHEVWYPTEEVWKRNRLGQKTTYQRCIVPGYIFARLDREPVWDVLFDRARNKLSRVVSRDGIPLPIPEAAIMEMEQVPQRLAAIKEQLRRERELRVGDRATLKGDLAWTVDITRIDRGIAYFVIPLLGGREANAPVEMLRKGA